MIHACGLSIGSITDDDILRDLPDDLDYVFHLACYHGNQSSIADPIADHDSNNLLTSLKLFDQAEGYTFIAQSGLCRCCLRGCRENFWRRQRHNGRPAGHALSR